MAEKVAEATAPAPAPDAATPPPAADAAAVAPQQTDAPDKGAESAETPPQATRRSAQELFDAGELTIEDILKLPQVQGHVGTLAERQAKERAAKEAAEARERELDRAAEDDPDNPLAKVRLEARQAAIIGQHASDLLQSGLSAYTAALPRELQAEYDATLKGKVYEGDYITGMAAHLKELVALEVKHERAKWEKEAAPAIRKEILAEVNGSEPSHDLGTGTSSGALTLERYRAMSPQERSKLSAKEIDSMSASVMRRAS